MKNKFLERAVKGTALEDALRVSQQLMEAKLKMPYASGSKKDIGAGLKSFSKKIISNKQLNNFITLVNIRWIFIIYTAIIIIYLGTDK